MSAHRARGCTAARKAARNVAGDVLSEVLRGSEAAPAERAEALDAFTAWPPSVEGLADAVAHLGYVLHVTAAPAEVGPPVAREQLVALVDELDQLAETGAAWIAASRSPVLDVLRHAATRVRELLDPPAVPSAGPTTPRTEGT